MRLILLSIGKTQSKELATLEQEYAKRIRGRFQFEMQYVKNEKEMISKAREYEKRSLLVLCDERGKEYSSSTFAEMLEGMMLSGRDLVFVIGDAAGFSPEMRDLAQQQIALSQMTFPHEMARVMLIEQIYRAQTILDGHPYHK